jgi:hypothetical protein
MEEYRAPIERNKLFLSGLFKILFTIIVVLLLLGAFNYFNIFSISNFFSKQLGWLPRRAVVQKKLLYTPTTPTLTSSPAVFNYDTEKAKILLTQYIKDTIKPELLPAQFDIKQGLIEGGAIEPIKYQFGYLFSEQKSTIYANFVYKENSNIQDGYGVVITPENTNQEANISIVNPLLSNYFTNPYVVSDCKARGKGTICENFQTTSNGKVGYGLYKNQSLKVFVLFACFVPKEGQYYKTVTSCIR